MVPVPEAGSEANNRFRSSSEAVNTDPRPALDNTEIKKKRRHLKTNKEKKQQNTKKRKQLHQRDVLECERSSLYFC